MAYSVNWATKVITIPKADTTLVSSSPDVRSLDVGTQLWVALRDIQDDVAGIVNVDMVKNTPPLTVAGLTLARVIEVVNGFKLQFEDGQYAVNIIGGNSNVADVIVKNQVAVNTANSAGMVVVTSGSGLSNAQATQLQELHQVHGLDAANPMRTHSTWRKVPANGSVINQTVTEDTSAGTVTVQRI